MSYLNLESVDVKKNKLRTAKSTIILKKKEYIGKLRNIKDMKDTCWMTE